MNKHRDVDGKLVYQGTTDHVDDADCGFIMDVMERHDSRAVTFRNVKMRGDVATSYGLEYLARGSWRDRVESVHVMDDNQIADAQKADRVAAMLDRNERLITAIRDVLKDAHMNKTALVAAIREGTGEGRKRVLDVLDSHAGKHWRDGHRWTTRKGADNATVYAALEEPPYAA